MIAVVAMLLAGPSVAERIVTSAKAQALVPTVYDPAYVRLAYPGGDVPEGRGVCSDVVVRALRSVGYDLQALVHKDIKANWKLYPRYSGLAKPDANIDHRRVKNLRVFLARFGTSLSTDLSKIKAWKPGDIVTWDLGGGLDHIGILIDKRGASGLYLVVHNLGGMHEDDSLGGFKAVTGHYRFPKL